MPPSAGVCEDQDFEYASFTVALKIGVTVWRKTNREGSVVRCVYLKLPGILLKVLHAPLLQRLLHPMEHSLPMLPYSSTLQLLAEALHQKDHQSML